MPPTLPQTLGELLERGWTTEEAFAYCERLARTHYENFHLGTFLFPRALLPHLYALYAYCRWADDLADEAESPEAGRSNLDRFAEWVEQTFAGAPPNHPVFLALAETIRNFRIPKKPFLDLLVAFRWDLERSRWETFEDLLEYCTYSANPVGRMFLALYGVRDRAAAGLADATSTGLQLANHWQDVARDLKERDRIYIPREDLAAHGLAEADLAAFANGRAVDDRWRRLMRMEVERAREFFRRGAALGDFLPGRFRLDVRLFTLAGWRVLDEIERAEYDVFRARPALTHAAKTGLLFRALFRRLPA